MITIIHGENTKESRNYYFEKKQQAPSPIVVEGLSASITDIAQKLEGKGLFENEPELFIEELYSKRKKGKDIESIIEYIKTHGKNVNITFWESKNISAKEIAALGDVAIKKFDFPKQIFTFLDSIVPGNSKLAMQLFHKTIDIEDTEFVFFMMIRHFRILIALSSIPLPLGEGSDEGAIDEVKRLAPWQREKLEKHAKLFGEKNLIDFYMHLFTIEQNMKTGKLPLSLTGNVDFLLSSL